MTTPALPADDSAGNTWTAAKVNAIYDLLEYFRDNRPMLRVQVSSQVVANDTLTAVDYIASGTEAVNVGGWVDAGTSSEGYDVPDGGVHLCSIYCLFADGSTGTRQGTQRYNDSSTGLTFEASPISATVGERPRAGISDLILLTAATEIWMQVYHNTGGNEFITSVMSAVWLNSAAS